MPEPREQPFVRLRAHWLENQRAIGGTVKSDGRHTTLSDGRLHTQVPDRCEDLRLRWSRGDGQRWHRRRRGGAAAPVEGRQGERGDAEDAEDDSDREPPGSRLRAPSIRAKPRGVT
jgi:hypothetical protein